MVGRLVKLGLGLSNRNTACVSRREVDVPRCDAMSHLQVSRRQPPAAYGGGEAGVSRRITRGTPASRWLTTGLRKHVQFRTSMVCDCEEKTPEHLRCILK